MEIEKDADVVTKANGLLRSTQNCKFIATLIFVADVLSKTYFVSKYLQTTNLDLVTAFELIDNCISDLKFMGTDNRFSDLMEEAKLLANKCAWCRMFI